MIVYGARCTRWETPDKAGSRGEPAIQCCPQCNGTLFHIESEARWIADAGRYESNGHPDYVAILRWGRGQCFPNAAILANRFRNANPVGDTAE
jgi:hypothetical protein